MEEGGGGRRERKEGFSPSALSLFASIFPLFPLLMETPDTQAKMFSMKQEVKGPDA